MRPYLVGIDPYKRNDNLLLKQEKFKNLTSIKEPSCKPNYKMIKKYFGKPIVLFENNDVYEYYFENGKTKWLYLFSIFTFKKK